MGNKKVLFSIALIIAVGVYFVNPTAVLAIDAKLIKIQSVQPVAEKADKGAVDQTNIEPKTLNIKEDTAVIWLNGLDKQVKIVFEVPIACQDVYPSEKYQRTVGRYWETCYNTTFLDSYESGSLLFDKAGVFEYAVRAEDGQTLKIGKIVVSPGSVAKNIK